MRAGHHHRSGAVIHSRRVPGGHGAILLESGLQRSEHLDGRVFAGRFILLKKHRWLPFFLCGNLHGNDLRLEAAFLDGGQRLAMRVQGELILLLALDAILLGNILTRDPHVVVVVNIPQPIVHHGVDDLRVAQAVSLARLRQQVGSVGHGFHAARDHDRTISCLHRLRRKGHRFQS